MRSLRVTLALACVTGFVLFSPTGTIGSAAPLPQAAAEIDVPVVVVMDTSDSMASSVPRSNASGSGQVVKIDAAKSAVLDVIERSEAGSDFGLIAYPAAAPTVDGCSPGSRVINLGPLDRARSQTAVRAMTTSGQTPTAPAMSHAARMLDEKGFDRGIIVLVSDGESNCGPPVCETAASLVSAGYAITVNSVGFDVARDSAAAEELRCAAEATGGAYFEADDADGINNAIGQAAGPLLDIAATVPAEIPAAVGQGTSGGKAVPVVITNTGEREALDVRVTLDFYGEDGVGGAVLVPRPVRFLGNLAPGDARRVEFEVYPDEALVGQSYGWSVSASSRTGGANDVDGDSTITRLDPGEAGELLRGVDSVAVIGDSYSSGEGAGDYLAGTDGGGNATLCHQSDRTYGSVLFGAENTDIIACSSAVTNDWMNQQESNGMFARSQKSQLEKFAESSTPPDAALLTLGGNDGGFGTIVRYCLASSKCSKARAVADAIKLASVFAGPKGMAVGVVADVAGDVAANQEHQHSLRKITGLTTSLVDVYDGIDRVLNNEDVVAQRDGAIAPILVLPYARILPRTESAIAGCQVGINIEEVAHLNTILEALNLMVSTAVHELQARGRPVYYVNDVQEVLQPNHTICEDSEGYAVFEDDLIEMYNRVTTTNTLGLPTGIDDSRTQELFHPNADGHAAIATAITAWSQHVAVLPSEPRRKPGLAATIASGLNIVGLGGLGRLVEAGGVIAAQGEGFMPGTDVTVSVESIPRTLASTPVDEMGAVATDVSMPDLPPGRHTLVLEGFDADGDWTRQERTIIVTGPYASEALILALIGLGAAIYSWRSLRWR